MAFMALSFSCLLALVSAGEIKKTTGPEEGSNNRKPVADNRRW
jgi:hypothetical protein